MDEYNYHKVLLHIDGDAFFASCEQATNPELRGKPIVIGYERGAATAYSYEAKKLGVVRGTKIKDIEKEYPEAILVSSDYKKYSLYSTRFKSIVSEFTQKIEKTSIDECYVDITGLDKELGVSYLDIIVQIQEKLQHALGITFSIGVGPTKTLAKIGSGMNKPHGITILSERYIKDKVWTLPIGYVPGIGYKTVPKMHAYGIFTIGDYVKKGESWVHDILSKPYQEKHKELQGYEVRGLEIENKTPKSISKIHAFKEPTSDQVFLLAELSRHCETITHKLRRLNKGATRISCGVKSFDEVYTSQEVRFPSPVDDPQTFFKALVDLLPTIMQDGKKYRATQVVISGVQELSCQHSLFIDDQKKDIDNKRLLKVIDNLDQKYGTGIITRASSGGNTRDNVMKNSNPLIYNNTGRKVLPLIYLGFCE